MDYSHLLARAGRIAWRNKFLWLFGFLAISGNVAANLSLRLSWRSERWWILLQDPDGLFHLYERMLQPAPLIGGLLILFTAVLVVWLVSAIAEGGLIRAAAQLDSGRSMSLRQTWQSGTTLLVRFILIDTVLFFPLFLLLLIAMLLGSGAFIGAILAMARGAALDDLVLPFAAVFLCLGALLLLLPAVALVTLAFRLFSFRATALQELAAMASIRHAWEVIRGNLVPVLIVGALLWGIRYLLAILFALILFPISLIAPLLHLWVGGVTAVYLATAVTLAAVLLHGAVQAILHTFFSTVWTIVYQSLAVERE